MADIDFQTQNSTNNAVAVDCGKPQQGADYARPMGVASSAPCESQIAIRILRLPEVMARIGLCRASIYIHMNQGSFPKSISLGPRAVGWLEHEIDAWLAKKILERTVLRKK